MRFNGRYVPVCVSGHNRLGDSLKRALERFADVLLGGWLLGDF